MTTEDMLLLLISRNSKEVDNTALRFIDDKEHSDKTNVFKTGRLWLILTVRSVIALLVMPKYVTLGRHGVQGPFELLHAIPSP